MEVGVESGVNKILGLMEKGQTTDDIEQVMKTTYNNDIGLSINWIPISTRELNGFLTEPTFFIQELKLH